jgi:hypothetical protein
MACVARARPRCCSDKARLALTAAVPPAVVHGEGHVEPSPSGLVVELGTGRRRCRSNGMRAPPPPCQPARRPQSWGRLLHAIPFMAWQRVAAASEASCARWWTRRAGAARVGSGRRLRPGPALAIAIKWEGIAAARCAGLEHGKTREPFLSSRAHAWCSPNASLRVILGLSQAAGPITAIAKRLLRSRAVAVDRSVLHSRVTESHTIVLVLVAPTLFTRPRTFRQRYCAEPL